MQELRSPIYTSILIISLIIITSCSPLSSENEGVARELSSGHALSKFTYPGPGTEDPGDTDKTLMNDMHVEFNEEGVRTKDMDKFNRASTDKDNPKVINLTKFGAPFSRTSSVTLEFERDGSFFVKRWWWTFNGNVVGRVHNQPPAD